MKNKAYLIDARNKTISLVEVDGYKQIQEQIDCDCFTVACDLPNGDTIYVDDEGLCKEQQNFFEFEGAHQPFAGNGLVLGLDDETGESRDVQSTLEEIKSKVTFKNIFQIRHDLGV
jgi:hypothetical protein